MRPKGKDTMTRMRKVNLVLTFALPLSLGASGAIADHNIPDATIAFEATDVGYIVRVEWGEGTLTMRDGTTHRFSVKGAEVLGAGVAKISASGEVHHLKNLSDFNGNFTHIDAGFSVIKGKKVSIMSNEAGVTIHLTAHQEGLQLSTGAGGLIFKLK